jgi:hypothetical protein
VTLALALAALALFYALLFPKPHPGLAGGSEPLSTDAGDDGELILWRWLQAEGIAVSSLRNRYDHLTDPAISAAATGNLLISVMPHRLAVREPEWQALTQWLERGNTLLVLAALEDTPRWTLGTGASFKDELQRLTQLSFSVLPLKAGASAATAAPVREQFKELFGGYQIDAIARGQHALLQGVQRLRAESELPASRWQASPDEEVVPLSIAQRADGQSEPVLWLLRAGEGQLIVCSLATPLSNREIVQAQNARLLSNIVAWSRGGRGRVIFDDAHQGLVDYYDPKAFFGDPRLHRTLWWIVLLWLAFVLGPLRPLSAHSPWQPVDETALIAASGRFYASVLAPHAAARRLLENFFDALRRRLRLTENGAPLWEWLETQPAVSLAQRARLQQLYARVCAEQRVELTQLQNLLSELQGRLT